MIYFISTSASCFNESLHCHSWQKGAGALRQLPHCHRGLFRSLETRQEQKAHPLKIQSKWHFFFCCFLLGKTEDSRLHRRLTIPGRRRVGRWIEEKERKAVRVSDKCHTQDGSASEVGWNKCYRERPGIVFFPWSPPSLSPPSLTVVVGRCPVKKGAGQAQFHSTGPVCIQWIDTDEEVQHNGWITTPKIDPPQNTYTQPEPWPTATPI